MADNIFIMNGAVLKFEISFTVPANSNLSNIKVQDKLAPGLDFVSLSGKKTVNGVDTPLTIQETTSSDPYYLSSTAYTAGTPSYFELLLNDQPNASNQEVSYDFTALAKVANIDELIGTQTTTPYTFSNIAQIIPFVNNVEQAPLIDTANVTFSKYILYGFGGADTIPRQADQNVIFPIYVPTFDAFSPDGTDAMKYVVTLTPNADLDVITNSTNMPVTVYTSNGSGNLVEINPSEYTINYQANSVEVTVPHSEDLRNTTLYIVPIGKTGADIVNTSANRVYSNVSLKLVDSNTVPTTLITTDSFDVTTNITDDLIISVKKTLI